MLKASFLAWLAVFLAWGGALSTSAAQNRMQAHGFVTGLAEGDGLGDVNGVAGVGDVNGDGFDDVVVSAKQIRPTGSGDLSGYAYLLLGAADASEVEVLHLDGENRHDHFGTDIAAAGDLNGDGYADFAIAAASYPEHEGRGKVYIYLGASTPDTVADWVLIGRKTGQQLGFAVESAGDVNGDAFDDLLVSDLSESVPQHGTIRLYLGGAEMDTLPDWRWSGDGLLTPVPGADLNDDGFDDIIVVQSVLGGDPAQFHARILIFFGDVTVNEQPDFILFEGMGWENTVSLGATLDLNGDGFTDIVASGPTVSRWPDLGKAFVFYGGETINSGVDLIIWPPDTLHSDFGFALASAGDVNADGYDDLVIGDWNAFGNLGAVTIYLGEAQFDSRTDLRMVAGDGDRWFGMSVASAGDFNRDGFADIVVGAPEYKYHSRHGRAIIFLGNGQLTDVAVPERVGLPERFKLSQNWPNPFNDKTRISFEVGGLGAGHLRLMIYSIDGKEVKRLFDQAAGPGHYEVIWDGTDARGRSVASGVYFYRLVSDSGWQQVKKLLLLR